jgi:uncharacterized protein (TIGR02996 family)
MRRKRTKGERICTAESLNTQAAFIETIIENPEDDTPRLVYADWLDEHGDPARAELIRVQCRLEYGTCQGADLSDAYRRGEELLAAHKNRWLQPLGLQPNEAEFERGFVVDVDLAAAKFLALADALMSGTPLRKARLTGLAGRVEQLAALPLLGKLTSLVLRGNNIGSNGVAVLVASPHLARLEKLDLGRNNIGPEGVASLVNSPHLEELYSLMLDHNAVGDDGAVALAGWSSGDRLRFLELADNNIRRRGAIALARSTHLRSLEELGLAGNRIAPAGAMALATAPDLAHARVELSVSAAVQAALAESGRRFFYR